MCIVSLTFGSYTCITFINEISIILFFYIMWLTIQLCCSCWCLWLCKNRQGSIFRGNISRLFCCHVSCFETCCFKNIWRTEEYTHKFINDNVFCCFDFFFEYVVTGCVPKLLFYPHYFLTMLEVFGKHFFVKNKFVVVELL